MVPQPFRAGAAVSHTIEDRLPRREIRQTSLSLRQTLGLGFGGLAILILALGGLSLQRMSAMHHSMVQIRDHDLPASIAAARISLALGEVRR
jgi:hypothetical protein